MNARLAAAVAITAVLVLLALSLWVGDDNETRILTPAQRATVEAWANEHRTPEGMR